MHRIFALCISQLYNPCEKDKPSLGHVSLLEFKKFLLEEFLNIPICGNPKSSFVLEHTEVLTKGKEFGVPKVT